MVEGRELPQKIWFFEYPGAPGKEAYLIQINDQKWAYPPDPAVLGEDPYKVGAFLLDPMRIVEETNSASGQTYYAYRMALPEDP